jgi:hypothetical protein
MRHEARGKREKGRGKREEGGDGTELWLGENAGLSAAPNDETAWLRSR